MSLLDEIQFAQRNAGEQAVIANLQRQGLLPSEPAPMYPQGIINQLEGEAKVLRALLKECVGVISVVIDDEIGCIDGLEDLKNACIEALKVAQ